MKAKFKFTGEEAPARGVAVSATADLSFECRSVRGKKKEKKRAPGVTQERLKGARLQCCTLDSI